MNLSNTPLYSTQEIIEWLDCQRNKTNVRIEEIPLSQLTNWYADSITGNIMHDSGRFFSVIGLEVFTNFSGPTKWSQPIIKQDEIGILGIITKEFGGIAHYLMQAKIEPGNINHVQLSPTIQATKSNYNQVHRGAKPTYLDLFLDSKNEVIFDQLQSEQGARFLKKRNRNVLIRTKEEFEVYDNYKWMTLDQIIDLMRKDNLVNMDTRTVLSGLSQNIDSENNAFIDVNARHSFRSIISWITRLKSEYELNTKEIPLNQVENWIYTDQKIYHKEGKYFEVIGVNVEIEGREVTRWTQPMIKPVQEGICAFIVKKINGIFHFLVQGKVECGNFDVVELAPTVQCLTGNYTKVNQGQVPYLEYILSADKKQILYDTMQSEEGGRFFKEQNRNLIVEANETLSESTPAQYIWMTAKQLDAFIMFNNYANIQTRSIMAAILDWKYD